LGVLDAPVEFGVVSEPSATEPGVSFEFCDALVGSGDAAVELLDGRLPVGDPVPLGPSLGPGGEAAPPVSLASSNVRQVHPVFGVLALATRLIEIARSTASGV
jgi:hypothetical protein